MSTLRRRERILARWCLQRSFVVEAGCTADAEIGGWDTVWEGEQGEEGEEAAVCGVCAGEIVIVREVTVNTTERAHVERRLIWRHQRCQFIATIMAEQETSSMEIDEVKLLTWC